MLYISKPQDCLRTRKDSEVEEGNGPSLEVLVANLAEWKAFREKNQRLLEFFMNHPAKRAIITSGLEDAVKDADEEIALLEKAIAAMKGGSE